METKGVTLHATAFRGSFQIGSHHIIIARLQRFFCKSGQFLVKTFYLIYFFRAELVAFSLIHFVLILLFLNKIESDYL